MNFISCSKCGRRDLRCNCSYSRSLVIISLMMLVLCGCDHPRNARYDVIDASGNKFENLEWINGTSEWQDFRDSKGKILEFRGPHTTIER
jgi:hypothetical protein